MDGFKNTTRMQIMGKQSGGRVSAPIVPVTRRSDEPNVSVGGVGGGYGPSYGGATGPAMRAGDAAARFASSGTLSAPRGPARGVGLNVRIPLKKGGAAEKAPSAGAAVGSGNRMSKMDAKDYDAVQRTTKPKPERSRMPSPGESVASGNRMSSMDTDDLAAVTRTTPRAKGGVMKKKTGGLAVMPKASSKNSGSARKYAEGGAVMPPVARLPAGAGLMQQQQQPPMPVSRLPAGAGPMQQQRPPMPPMPPVAAPSAPVRAPQTSGRGGISNRIGAAFQELLRNQNPKPVRAPQTSGRGGIGAALLQPKPVRAPQTSGRGGIGAALLQPKPVRAPQTSGRGGNTDPRMKKGGLAAMPKGGKGKC